MANNRIQVKRTSVAGRTANTTDSGNSQYISAGEFALNMEDRILYTSNGSTLITVGANLVNQRITNSLTIDNDRNLYFKTVNTSATVGFRQQNDDNFVFYSTNTTYGQRAIWAIFANSDTSALSILTPITFNGNVNQIVANGTLGTAGQVLATNGGGIYWTSVGGTGTVTSVGSANGVAGGPITGTGTLYVVAGNSTVFVNASGVHVNTAALPSGGAGVNVDAQYVWTNTHTFNQTIVGTVNNALFLGGNSAANLRSYSDNTAATAYSNAVSYVDGKSYVNTSQLSSNLSNYQTSAGLASNVATLTSNNATNAFGKTENNLNVNSALYANASITNTFTVGTASYFVANGNFGVGVASPTSKIDVAGEVNILTTNTGAPTNPLVATIQSNTNFSSGLVVRKRGNVSDINGSVLNNAEIGYHSFFGWDGTNYVRGAYVIARATEDWSGTARGSKLSYLTTANGTTINVERLTIDQSGNVGISNVSPDARLAVTGTANISGNVVIGGITTFNANIVLGSSGLSANGGFGTAGHTLHSNGTATYWAADDNSGGTVTSVATGNGMTGGTITATGTVSILANTGVVANATGLFVNATYIGTLTANNTSFVGTVSAANVVSNAQLSANLANYQTTAGLSANVATLTANNATNLGGVAAAAYVQNTDSRTLSGNLVFSAANVNYTGNLRITGGLIANGGLGTAGDVLTSNGSSVYWTVGGSGSSNAVYMKGGAATIGTLAAGGSNIFRVNANTLNYNTTIATGENASATGPIAVSPGVTLTVETGARVSII